VVCVIGGERVFKDSLSIATQLDLTEIQRDFEGDTRFPAYDRSQWREKKRETHTAANGMRFDFVLYEKA
jgi:dihydrofolate reductase